MRLGFLHLPKTGGTSLSDFIRSHISDSKTCPEFLNSYDKFSDEDLKKYEFYSGHFDFKTLSRFPTETFKFTILRKPKDRICSLYYFWKSYKDSVIELHDLKGPRIAKSHTLIEFLRIKDKGIPVNIDNAYVRNLMGPTFYGVFGKDIKEEDALNIAKLNLEKFDHVGFLENFRPSFEKVSKILGVDPPKVLPKKRSFNEFGKSSESVLVNREALGRDVEFELEKLTYLDDIIYEHAIKLSKIN